MDLPEINLKNYSYLLPEDRIAQHPLSQRDESKLLVYANGSISHQQFKNLGDHLPEGTTLVFNDTRVIPARLNFQKSTGALIEVFLLHPTKPSVDINLAMQAKGSCTWHCMIGNGKRWKKHQLLQMKLMIGKRQVVINALRVANGQVQFDWDAASVTFVELIKGAGQVPLPPYMKRKAELEDRRRYQTVYSKSHGAVAAPTAGLHFTDSLLTSLESQGVTKKYLTLHVGAGTFLPIKTETVTDHPMHGEQINITMDDLDHLTRGKTLVAVGTTSLRTLESLYWYGVKLVNKLGNEFHIEKLAPYRQYEILPDFIQALNAVKKHMEANNYQTLRGYTEVFIFPPYRIKSCRGLITNFHLPSSTLILLVAAFLGDQWQEIYQEALDQNYRFLSYGDSSLLLPRES